MKLKKLAKAAAKTLEQKPKIEFKGHPLETMLDQLDKNSMDKDGFEAMALMMAAPMLLDALKQCKVHAMHEAAELEGMDDPRAASAHADWQAAELAIRCALEGGAA